MTQEMRLLRLIGETDERYAEFARGDCPNGIHPRGKRLKCLAVAACLVLVLAGVLSGIRLLSGSRTDEKEPVHPEFVAGQLGAMMAATSYIGYEDLAARSQAIVCADVLQTYREEMAVYARICVRETLKGEMQAGDTLLVTDTAGGHTDAQGQYAVKALYGDPLLEKGKRVLLFLYRYPEPVVTANGQVTWSVFGSVGKLFYDTDGKYHWSMLYNENYPDKYTPTMMLWDSEPKTLAELRKMIQDGRDIDVTASGFASMSRSPYAGELVIRPHFSRLLNELQAKYEEFLIGFYVYDENGIPLSRDKTTKERTRLASLGYRIYQKPSTQPQCEHEIVGVFTLDELNSFIANADHSIGTYISDKMNPDVLNKHYGYCFGDIWNSGNDLTAIMDDSLRVKGDEE